MKSKTFNTLRRSRALHGGLVLSLIVAMQLLPTQAFAADDAFTSVTTALETVSDYVTGSFGRVVAIIIVCFLGLLAFIGRLSLPVLFQVLVGMAFIFGASSIITSLSSSLGN